MALSEAYRRLHWEDWVARGTPSTGAMTLVSVPSPSPLSLAYKYACHYSPFIFGRTLCQIQACYLHLYRHI